MLTRHELEIFDKVFNAESPNDYEWLCPNTADFEINLVKSHLSALDEIDRLTAERQIHLDIIEQLKHELGQKDLSLTIMTINDIVAKQKQGNTTGNLLIPKPAGLEPKA